MESRPRRPRLCVAPALALGLLGFGPCDDRSAAKARGAEEELTIVVEADKTRIAAEDAKLLERTRNLEDQKKQLDKQISDLEARKKQGAAAMTPLVRNRIESQEKELRASGAALAQEFVGIDQRREELVKQRDELLTKVTTGIAGGVESKSAILAGREQAMVVREKDTAGREKDVASREKAVAERERALADRERTVAAREASAGAGASRRSLDKGAEVSRAEFEAYYKKVLALMKSKGLQDEDLPSDKQNLTAEVQAARRAGDLSKADRKSVV